MTDKKQPEDLEKPEQDDSSEKETGSGRRRLLKGLAAGSAVIAGQEVLPEKWSKPLVDAVVLPAHAQLTTGDGAQVSSDDDEEGTDDGAADSPDDLQGVDASDDATDLTDQDDTIVEDGGTDGGDATDDGHIADATDDGDIDGPD